MGSGSWTLVTMRAINFVFLVSMVQAEAGPDAYTLEQVSQGLPVAGIITGIDYGHGLVPGAGVRSGAPPPTVTVPIAGSPLMKYLYARAPMSNPLGLPDFDDYNRNMLRGHIPRLPGPSTYARHGVVKIQMADSSSAGSTGDHKIRIRQGGRSCFTEYLTNGPWAGETYDADICMSLNFDKCITFEVHNNSYYDPSQVHRVIFSHDGEEMIFTYDVNGGNGWFHSDNIREHRAC